MQTYDPWDDLRARGHLTLSITRLPIGDAMYFADVPGIALDERLSRTERRCVLAHELAHIDLGHTHQAATTCSWDLGTSRIARRHELEADKLTARRLVLTRVLADALCRWDNPWAVADDLDVTEHVLETRLAHLHPAERGYISRRLATKEAVA